MAKEQSSISLEYPIYGAKFINNKTVLVIGGGGEGSNGIPNKITALKCSFKTNQKNRIIQRFREIQLPANEDSPQVLDFVKTTNSLNDDGTSQSEYQILVGCNQSSELLKTMNINNNVRKYRYNDEEHLMFEDAAQFEAELDGDTDEYPKVIKLASNNSIGCIMTSKLPSTLYFFDPSLLELKHKYITNVEIKDFEFNKDGSKLFYITSNSIFTYSTETNSIISEKHFEDYKLSKIKLINDSEAIVSATYKGKSAYIIKFSLTNNKIIKEQLISKNIKNIVALDISIPQDLIAVAGNDLSLTLIQLSNLKTIQTFKKLHPFAITCVTFSPNGTKLATGSAANILNVIRIPPKYLNKSKTSIFGIIGTLVQYLFTIILMIFIAFGVQKLHEAGKFNDLMIYTKDYRDIGSHYGKFAYDYAEEYGKLAYDYAQNYGKLAYEYAEEYGKRYGSKAKDIYNDKIKKAKDHEQDFKNTLNDIVQEVTKDFKEITKEDFDSETLNDIKLTTSILSTDVTSTSNYISTDATFFNEIEPELEKPIEILNNSTVNSEQVEQEIEKERNDRNEINQNETDSPVEEIDIDVNEDIDSSYNKIEPELEQPIEIIDSASADIEEIEAKIEKERKDRIDKNVENDEVEDSNTFNKVESEIVDPIEVLTNKNTSNEEIDAKIEKERQDRFDENEAKNEDSNTFNKDESEIVDPIEVLDNKNTSNEEVDAEIEKEKKDRNEIDENVDENIAQNIPNYEAAKIETYEDDTNTELKPEDLEEKGTELQDDEFQNQGYDDDKNEEEEVIEEIVEVIEEDPNDESEIAEENSEFEDDNQADDVEVIEEIVEIEEIEESQDESLPNAEDDVSNSSVTDEELIETDTDSELPSEVTTSSEETIETSTQEEFKENVEEETEEVKYTPEDPTPIESQHTVEVSGTGRDEPTLNEEEIKSEIETFENPEVEISTPSTEAVSIETTEIEPANDEPSTIEPTASSSEINENIDNSSDLLGEESISIETTKSTTSSTTITTSNSIKTRTKKFIRTIKKTKTSKPTKNPIEKDEL
ncbi:SED4 [Candida pseudojiufengensis]|uniref:SED4 n=1 Tax=Candida pseudojiufengensis TaxID=497109 RepID=UPI0022248842|nr:SED4 [Candida pseudojiufengensis]KAI5963036.1 SED4 [Candida pseudojiufengensis]